MLFGGGVGEDNENMKKFWTTGWAVFAAAWMAGTAWAGPEGQNVQFSFEGADIRQVTALAGKLTGRNYIVPDGVEGTVSVLTQGPVARADVLPLFEAILEASGYTTVKRGGAWVLTPLGQADGIGGEETAQGGLVTKVVVLDHVPASEVKGVLEPLVRNGGSGGVGVFPTGNRLIVTDTAEKVARVESLVRELDVAGAGNTVELVTLEHAPAEEVAKQLRAVYGATDSAANKVHAHMTQVAGGGGGLPASFAVGAAPQANGLILVGSPMQIADAKRMAAMMDVESPYGFGRLNAIFLQYLNAEEAAKSLNSLFGKGAAEGAEGAAARRGIAIEPSVANNALLVDAESQDFEYVRRLVAQLDTVPQQVLVEVLIAEVNLKDSFSLGVEWFGIDEPKGNGSGGVGRTMYGNSDGMMGLLKEGQFSQGLSLAFLSGTFTAPDGTTYHQLPVYLRALAGDTDLKILSNIPLWAQNNREATVSVVENIPILKSSVEGSGSDRDYIQNIERQDVGIKLALTPHVNPDREIQLELNPSIEAVVEGGRDNYTPTISKREVKTTVTVPDRSTVVLSGLIREDEAEIVSKVPLLGDIPLLGWLFRNTQKKKERTNLLIFVTPRIVTDMKMAEKERERLERATGLAGAREALERRGMKAEKTSKGSEKRRETSD